MAERALIGDEGAGQPHHVVERFRDVADLSIDVPLFQLRDHFVDNVVEYGVRDLVLVLEIVIEERSGHADATRNIADSDFRKALFQADFVGCAHDLRTACVSDCHCGSVVLSVHGSLLRSSGVSHLRDMLTLCQFLDCLQSKTEIDMVPIS